MIKVDGRSVTGSTRRTGVRQYPFPVKSKVKLRTSGDIQSGLISVLDETIMESYCRCNILKETGTEKVMDCPYSIFFRIVTVMAGISRREFDRSCTFTIFECAHTRRR